MGAKQQTHHQQPISTPRRQWAPSGLLGPRAGPALLCRSLFPPSPAGYRSLSRSIRHSPKPCLSGSDTVLLSR